MDAGRAAADIFFKDWERKTAHTKYVERLLKQLEKKCPSRDWNMFVEELHLNGDGDDYVINGLRCAIYAAEDDDFDRLEGLCPYMKTEPRKLEDVMELMKDM